MTTDRTIEVFADVGCPFAHVGLVRLVEERARRGAEHVRLRVRPWPLELVNGEPLDGWFIGEEVDVIRAEVATDLFTGFDAERFPSSFLPAFALGEAAYAVSDEVGEAVSLALRRAVFEEGRDVADPGVLAEIASGHGVPLPDLADGGPARASWEEGKRRGVVGSPHFFVDGQGWFCPVLDIRKDGDHLTVAVDHAAFDAFATRAFT